MKQIFLIILCIFKMNLAHASSQAVNWDINDVSILLPLSDPAMFDDAVALRPDTIGSAGALIQPRELSLFLDGDEQSHLRAVAIRIDPCFPFLEFTNMQNCQAQIRIVWQPVYPAGGSASSAYVTDNAIHSFYNISQIEFLQLITAIKNEKAKSNATASQLPLQIQPIISSQGMKGPYWTALRQIILSLTGANRLSRVTSMSSVNALWTFGGVNVVNQADQTLEIPRINVPLQQLFNATVSTGFTSVGFASPIGQDAYLSLLSDSNSFKSKSLQVQQQALDIALFLENPKFSNANTVDCASCHLAQSSRLWLEGNLTGLNISGNTLNFTAPNNLTNLFASPSNSEGLRGFGYYNASPTISQRVINESSVIVDYLNGSGY
jgi:hypothetical protein